MYIYTYIHTYTRPCNMWQPCLARATFSQDEYFMNFLDKPGMAIGLNVQHGAWHIMMFLLVPTGSCLIRPASQTSEAGADAGNEERWFSRDGRMPHPEQGCLSVRETVFELTPRDPEIQTPKCLSAEMQQTPKGTRNQS